MSGGKIGGDFIGFELAAAAVSLAIAGGAAALSQARQAQELTRAIRQQETQLEQRREMIRNAGQAACMQFERQLEIEVFRMAKLIERQSGRIVTARKPGETLYDSFARLVAMQKTGAVATEVKFIERPENLRLVFDEICAISEELLPFQWSRRPMLENSFQRAKQLFAKSTSANSCRTELLGIRDTLRTERPEHLRMIREVESLRRQYLEEVAMARALYAITEDQITVEDFCYESAATQIARLRQINEQQRKRLNEIYENPTYAMTPETRQKAVRQVSDRIEAAMATCRNPKVGGVINPSTATRYYKYGNAYLRCTVAENGTIVMEVVGDSFGERDKKSIVQEMQRFQSEFPSIQSALLAQGVGFEKYAEYAPCEDDVCFFNVKEKEQAATTAVASEQKAVAQHEEM